MHNYFCIAMVNITYLNRAQALDLFWEVSLGGIFIAAVILASLVVRVRTNDGITARYFLPGLLFKISGLLLFCAMYYFVYGYGDTFVYHESAGIFAEIISEDFQYGIELLLGTNSYVRAKDMLYNHFLINYYRGADTFLVIKLAAVINVFGFGRFLSTSILFALLTFLCQWYLFKTLFIKYSKNERSLAIAILFIPSVAFWGSGIMKDSIIFGSICLLTAIFFRWIELSIRPRFWQIVVLVSAFYIIYIIKFYVIIAFLPSLGFWVYFKFNKAIRNKVIRMIITPLGISFLSSLLVFSFVRFSEIDQRLQVERMLDQAEIYQRNHYSESGGDGTGSGYTLGDYDPSFAGIIFKVIPAINVSLFRPYLWEIRGPAMAMAGLESFWFTLLFIRLLWYWRSGNARVNISSDAFLLMSVIFLLFFAFVVGFTAYNFGALVRYKIPCLPFFYLLLTLPVQRVLVPVKGKWVGYS